MNVILSGLYPFRELMGILNLFDDENLRFDKDLINKVRVSKDTFCSDPPYNDADLPVECCYNWLLNKYMDIPIILTPEQLASKNAPILRNFIINYFCICRICRFSQKFRIEYVRMIRQDGRMYTTECPNSDYNNPAINKEDYVWYG